MLGEWRPDTPLVCQVTPCSEAERGSSLSGVVGTTEPVGAGEGHLSGVNQTSRGRHSLYYQGGGITVVDIVDIKMKAIMRIT